MIGVMVYYRLSGWRRWSLDSVILLASLAHLGSLDICRTSGRRNILLSSGCHLTCHVDIDIIDYSLAIPCYC